MEIKTSKQYNQGIGKYKVLSSNAGVGAIVATKWGGFIMPKSSSDWVFVSAVSQYLKNNPSDVPDYKKIASETGVEIIEDNRFVGFLKDTEGMTHLRCLVTIPHISLSQNNICEVKEHPAYIRYKEEHPTVEGLSESTFTIPAIVFPRWFYSRKTSFLRPIEDWIRIWKEKGCNGGDTKYFAPPRDPDIKTNRKQYDNHLPDGKNMVHGLLEQVSMVLICPNGHISDIPWRQYFSAKLDGQNVTEEGFDLFAYQGRPCTGSRTGEHELQWLENRNHAESFGTLKCNCCGKSVSLEGIMNLQPLCCGDKPWEGVGKKDFIPCRKKPLNVESSTMRWAMVTSNSVYYAENFSSLFIPDCYGKGDSYLDDKQQKVLNLMVDKWFCKYEQKHPGATRKDYIDAIGVDELISKADDSDYAVDEDDMTKIVNVFLGIGQDDHTSDVREKYRFDEYEVFQNNSVSMNDSDKLRFEDIVLPVSLQKYFTKIQQVHTLGMSSTQINFSRVSMPQPQINDDGTIEYQNRMKIFKEAPEDVLVMPANQSFGEGLFFSISEEALAEWESLHKEELENHYASIVHHDETYENIYRKMLKGGVPKFFLLHTFSHAIMKELEFSCGYPTASLSERLYFSDRMCGVLIYTADGAEGSMGGLVWQGQPTLIEGIIRKAMQRALNCASDPICWENDDQMNYAACFSCAMVSETSCEERNVGLDRRALVDENFGFFKDILQQ